MRIGKGKKDALAAVEAVSARYAAMAEKAADDLRAADAALRRAKAEHAVGRTLDAKAAVARLEGELVGYGAALQALNEAAAEIAGTQARTQ